ncbi:MAG: hypothetical protein OXI64_03910 [Defluviicoccus sp.]|nr:hypothetical protein [Defluviicoccus sp.]
MRGFSPGVWKELNYYVYLLIDPRNCQTFYVGKGKDDRLFAHVNDVLNLETDEERLTAKVQRIKEIRNAGYDVIHVVHRHGMDENTALEVEACLIDYIDDLKNDMSGIGVGRGPMTARQIERRYAAEPMVLNENHRLLFIVIKDSTLRETRNDVYAAVKGHWRLARKRASTVQYVLAMNRNLCIGVFRPDDWYDSELDGEEGRLGFNGTEVLSGAVFERYRDKKWPVGFRKPGTQTPVMYYPKG